MRQWYWRFQTYLPAQCFFVNLWEHSVVERSALHAPRARLRACQGVNNMFRRILRAPAPALDVLHPPAVRSVFLQHHLRNNNDVLVQLLLFRGHHLFDSGEAGQVHCDKPVAFFFWFKFINLDPLSLDRAAGARLEGRPEFLIERSTTHAAPCLFYFSRRQEWVMDGFIMPCLPFRVVSTR